MYKGMFLHMVAKVVFIISSYVIHFFLGNFLDPEAYGEVGVIITIINFGYLFLNNGVRQAISKELSQTKYNSNNIVKKGMLIQLSIVGIIVIITLLGAETLANFLGDKNLSPYIKFTSSIIPFMGMYFAMLGIFNGYQMFRVESAVVTIYPLIKLIIIPLVYFYMDSVLALEIGFLISAISIMLICFISLLCKGIIGRTSENRPKIKWITFAKSSLSFSIIFIAAAFIMNIDTIFVKAIINDDAATGYYTAVINFSKIPYYLLTAIFLVILPIISKYYSEGKIEIAKNTISNILNAIGALILPIIIIISSSSAQLLAVFYKKEYATAQYALIFLMFGNFFLGLTILINMILSAINRKLFTSLIAIFLIVSETSLCISLIPIWGINGAALANLFTSGVSFIVSFFHLVKLFGNICSYTMLINILFSFFSGFLVYIILKTPLQLNVITLFFVYALIYLLHFIILVKSNLIDIKSLLGK